MTPPAASARRWPFCAVPPPAWAQPPDEPRVLDDMPELGKPGGELRSLIGRARDTRLLYVFGHARLVGYDLDLNLVPDILASYEVEDGRSSRFRLRRGHRWSDGQPFTAEDFRFCWEDVANNPTLQPSGPRDPAPGRAARRPRSRSSTS